jgi:uncharacterized protein (TIGR00725 family)
MKPSFHYQPKFKICVSGAAETEHCIPDVLEKAKEIGREIIRHKAVLINGATSGFPFWAAVGAKEENGITIGFSPASSEKDHLENYKLPVDYLDIIVYTGFDFAGRNLLLTRASDGVIIGCGRMGTLNEFTIAFEDNKPVGILTGSGGTTEMLKEIVEKAQRGPGKIVYDSNPKTLVEKVIALIKKEKIIEV